MKSPFKDALRGAAIAAPASAAAWALAALGFGRDWYLGVLLPLAALLCALAAWLLYLREDGLARGAGAPPREALRPDPPPPGAPGRPELGLFAPRDVLVERSGAGSRGERSPEGGDGRGRELRRALAWAAAELALVSVLLYRLAGVGSRYFG